jgi:phytoene desaturase
VSEVAVIGGGVGGMATAIRLAARGHRVSLYERRTELGGKLTEWRHRGFSFGLGPSLLTLPGEFAALAAEAGRKLDELVTLQPTDPVCRYRFADGSVLDAAADPAAMAAAVDRLAPGEGAAWQRYRAWGERCWAASQRSFLGGPLELAALRHSPGHPADLLASAPGQTLAGHAARFFHDPRMRQYAGRYATYSGSSPYRAPAALGCIPYLEHAHGAWYVAGGLARLRDALVTLLAETGVAVHTSTEVTRVLSAAGAVTGVVAGGQRVAADVVVSDADSARLYRDLYPDRGRRRRIGRLGPSSSGLLLLAAVRGRTPGLAHHNVIFSADYRAEFADLFGRHQPPADPTIYVGCSATVDPSAAPAGHENWTVLVNVPAGPPDRWPCPPAEYQERLLAKLGAAGLDVTGRLLFTEMLTPADFERRYDGWQGSIYGTPQHGRLAPFRRPGNRGPVRGLYLAGGSVHPGGGLPLVVIGSRIVADMVTMDLGTVSRGRP